MRSSASHVFTQCADKEAVQNFEKWERLTYGETLQIMSEYQEIGSKERGEELSAVQSTSRSAAAAAASTVAGTRRANTRSSLGFASKKLNHVELPADGCCRGHAHFDKILRQDIRPRGASILHGQFVHFNHGLALAKVLTHAFAAQQRSEFFYRVL